MSDNIFRTNHAFLSIYDEIDKELSDAARNIENLSDEELTDSRYINISRHLDHIQRLFDRASVAVKNLTLDQSNPELYKILECKAVLNEKYGVFHRMRSSVSARVAQLQGKTSGRELDLAREGIYEPEADVPEEGDESPEEQLDEEPPEEFEDLQPDEDKLGRKHKKKHANRRDVAAQMGMPTAPGKEFTEAELRNERYRQEEMRRQEEQRAIERRAREAATFAEYQRRMEQAASFEGLDKSHIDYAPNLDPRAYGSDSIYGAANPSYPYTNDPLYNPSPLGYSPTGTAPIYAGIGFTPTPEPASEISGNKEIYSFLTKQASPSAGQSQPPYQISSAFEQQMRFNLETARMDYHAARGTPEEKAAAHRYFEERSAYSDFSRAVKEKRFEIQELPPAPTEASSRNVKAPQSVAAQSPFLCFTPDGVEGAGVSDGKLTRTSLTYNNPGLTVNTCYTASSPLTVTPEYEAQIMNRMRLATSAVNAIVAKGGSGKTEPLPHYLASELKLATEAYLGFRNAKAAGSVVISHDGEAPASKTPDYRMWQQQYTTKSKNINISQTLGTTGQFRGANFNKVAKGDVEEVSTSTKNSDLALMRQSVAGVYFSIIGMKFQDYSRVASMQLSRKMYQLIQDGDDNPVRTFENGRYYVTTGLFVGAAIIRARPVSSTASSAAKLARKEYLRYGNLTLLNANELSAQITEHRKAAGALKKEINNLIAKGHALTESERELLIQLKRQHRQASGQLKKEINYQRFCQVNAATLAVARELKLKHPRFVTIKHVDAEIRLTQTLKEEEIVKRFNFKTLMKSRQGQELEKIFGKKAMLAKYGSLPRATDKSIAKKIAELDKQGPLLKAQIKLLEAKGSALTAAERAKLIALRNEHKDNSFMLRKLKGLLKVRGKWDARLNALERLRLQMVKNKNAWTGGFYAIQNLMLKPIFAGLEFGPLGLAKGLRFVTNPYVLKLIKKGLQASVFLGKAAIEMVAAGTVKAFETYASAAKIILKSKFTAAQYNVKKTAGKAVNSVKTSVKKTVKKYTPPKIKTSVEKGTAAAQKAKKGFRDAVSKTKKWFADTKVGKGLSAARNAGSKAAGVAGKGLSLAKGFALKALAIFAVVFLFVGIVSAIASSITGGSTAVTVIMSPYTSTDGKTSLMPYVEILQQKQQAWEAEIDDLDKNGNYEKVVVKYGTPALYNYKEILSMMAVKMDQDLDLSTNSEIKPYLEHLFDVSHSYTVSESYWECPGCDTEVIEKTVRCETEDGKCLKDESVNLCKGHKVKETIKVCRGHMNLYITMYVTGFDAIFQADESGISAYGATGLGSFDATLGGVSAKYEAGGINPGRISSGAGDHGGKSYGTWQLASNTGSLKSFMDWLKMGSASTPNKAKIYDLLSKHTLASESFDSAWKSVATTYYEEFQELQARYIYSSHVAPFISSVKTNKGVDLTRSKALTELAFSSAVQFGPGGWKVVGNINSSMSDKEIIQTSFAYKRDNVDTLFKSSSQSIRNSLKKNRFVTEEQDILSLIDAGSFGGQDENVEDNGAYWDKERRDLVYLLYQQDWADLYDVYFTSASGQLSDPMEDADIEKIIEACKAEYPEMSKEREEAIRNALSLVGKVQYYWGGGHEADLNPGWNDKWGTPAPASSSPTNTYTTWGLDCSGFIRWVFLTSYEQDVYPYTAQGIRDANLAIDSKDARPGDLANVPGAGGSADVHIGMYLYTRADGQRMFVHCGSSAGVSLTTEYQGGFKLYHKPALFSPN